MQSKLTKHYSFEEFELLENCKEIDDINEFKVSVIGEKGNQLRISIDGHEYGYKPLKGNLKDMIKSFEGIFKHSAGKAVAWLKDNSELVFGGKKK